MEQATFDDQFDPAEASISKILWDLLLDEPKRYSYQCQSCRCEHDVHLASYLEWYICGIFEKVEYTNSRNIWCDGFGTELLVEKIDPTKFGVSGLIYCPIELAPIDLVLHYKHTQDDQTERTTLRFGDYRSRGSKRRWAAGDLPRRTHNEDWLVAVELTNTST